MSPNRLNGMQNDRKRRSEYRLKSSSNRNFSKAWYYYSNFDSLENYLQPVALS